MERRLESSQRSSRSSPWTGFCSVWWVGKVRFNCASRSRTSKRGSGCRCPTRRSSCSSHLDTWTFISSSPLESDSHSPWMRQSWRQSEQFHSFQREGELGSWVHARRAPHMAVGGGVWTVFSLCFSDSVHFGRRVLAPRELFESPRWPTVVGRRRLALLIELVVTCHHGHLAPLTIVRNNNKDNRENKDNKDSKDNKAMHISQRALVCVTFFCAFMFAAVRAAIETGAARRRQRRLRQWLRHERLSVAIALAESQHHTSRGQKTARAGEEGHEEHDALRRQKPPPPQASSGCTVRKTPSGGRGRGRSQTLGRRRGSSGTPCSILSRPSCLCRCSMFLCR